MSQVPGVTRAVLYPTAFPVLDWKLAGKKQQVSGQHPKLIISRRLRRLGQLGDGLAGSSHLEASQVSDGTGGSVLAGDPFGIGQLERTGLGRNMERGVQNTPAKIAPPGI